MKKLLVVLAIGVIAFLAYGFMLPEYEKQANAARRACEEMVKRGATAQVECDRLHAKMMAEGRARK